MFVVRQRDPLHPLSFCPLLGVGKALGHPSRLSREEQCAVTCDQLRGTPAPSPAHSPHDRRRCAVQVERYTSRSNDPCPLSFPDGRCVYLFGESNGDVCAGRGGSGVALSVHSDLQRHTVTPPALTDAHESTSTHHAHQHTW